MKKARLGRRVEFRTAFARTRVRESAMEMGELVVGERLHPIFGDTFQNIERRG